MCNQTHRRWTTSGWTVMDEEVGEGVGDEIEHSSTVKNRLFYRSKPQIFDPKLLTCVYCQRYKTMAL